MKTSGACTTSEGGPSWAAPRTQRGSSRVPSGYEFWHANCMAAMTHLMLMQSLDAVVGGGRGFMRGPIGVPRGACGVGVRLLPQAATLLLRLRQCGGRLLGLNAVCHASYAKKSCEAHLASGPGLGRGRLFFSYCPEAARRWLLPSSLAPPMAKLGGHAVLACQHRKGHFRFARFPQAAWPEVKSHFFARRDKT